MYMKRKIYRIVFCNLVVTFLTWKCYNMLEQYSVPSCTHSVIVGTQIMLRAKYSENTQQIQRTQIQVTKDGPPCWPSPVPTPPQQAKYMLRKSALKSGQKTWWEVFSLYFNGCPGSHCQAVNRVQTSVLQAPFSERCQSIQRLFNGNIIGISIMRKNIFRCLPGKVLVQVS